MTPEFSHKQPLYGDRCRNDRAWRDVVRWQYPCTLKELFLSKDRSSDRQMDRERPPGETW